MLCQKKNILYGPETRVMKVQPCKPNIWVVSYHQSAIQKAVEMHLHLSDNEVLHLLLAMSWKQRSGLART